jgi:hypothetical protein
MTSHLRRGALTTVDVRTGAQRTAIPFQYNPETLVRRLLPRQQPRPPDGEPDAQPGLSRPGDPPCEEICLGLELDAGDGTVGATAGAAALGLLPVLSALELLFDGTAAAAWRLEAGAHFEATEPPLLILEWGEHRRAPVRIAACTITEEAFDAGLVPTRARVDLTLDVLTFGDSPPGHPGRRLFREYMQAKERLAARR